MLRCDLTWLTSNYMCIFGQGCQGIYEESPDAGCCTLGAHFADKDDEKRVATYVDQLDADAVAVAAGPQEDPTQGLDRDRRRGRAQDPVVEVDGQSACIFHNRTDFHARRRLRPARAGASQQGRNPLETKPDVCWQLPIRRTFRTVERQDDTSYTEVIDRRVRPPRLGPGRPRPRLVLLRQHRGARRASSRVYVTNAAELTELMGEAAYDELVRHCEAHLRSRSALALHPADPR